MSKRLEAAVLAWDHYWGDRYGDEALEEMGEEVQVALNAADKVMFSDEAKALARVRLESVFHIDEKVGEHDANAVWGTPDEIIAEVISVLRGHAA